MMSDALQFLIFKNTLEELKLDHKARITSGVTYTKNDVTTLGNTVFQFVTNIVVYDNKESYLYYRYLDLHQKMPTAHYKFLMNEFAESMHMDEKTRIAEVAWEVKYRVHPSQFSVKDRSEVIVGYARKMRDYINKGYGGVAPCEGDVLTAFPYGPDVSMPLGMNSWLKGKEDRAKYAQFFGFGKVKTNGWCYGRYNSNLKLRPM
jgi:hypothetical protein